VRIPLDYYRILGLPLAASDEQLRQAYSDRIVQLPRREYSIAATTSRKQLVEEAYVVLSNPKERKEYDRVYSSHAYTQSGADVAVAVENRVTTNQNIDVQTPSIDVNDDELVGALLILQELGEYEQVLKLGRPYLVNKNKVNNDFASERPDVVLTVALACLELGREQWQQGNYENAVISLETGEELLGKEGMFPSVRTEIQADLYRLRPYRILELVALPLEQHAQRKQGLQLLIQMLEERGGIDGSGNDQSGLNIDDFLRFVQQLRHHLIVAEQHKLFEAESKRPSAVATYLAVYALIARGFTQRQPALIRQAKQMLLHLGKRQDVHLEQSLCALLLGQTLEATRSLELSQEYEALAFIREHSQSSPDLLPGLCLYGERWLQNEVFPHFRDLTNQIASLKDYFADSNVQAYLEALPSDAESINGDWRSSTQQNPYHNPPALKVVTSNHNNNSRGKAYTSQSSTVSEVSNPVSVNSNRHSDDYDINARLEAPLTEVNRPQANGRVSSKSQNNQIGTDVVVSPKPKRRRPQPSGIPRNVPSPNQRLVTRRRQSRNQLPGRLLLKVLASVAGVLIFWLLISTTFGWLKNILVPGPALKGEQLSIQINQPPVEIPTPGSQPHYPEGDLTKETATQVVQAWLSAKSASLGSQHDIDSLNQVLTGSALAYWRGIALQEKSSNRYRQYEHTVSNVSIEPDSKDKNNASVEASVVENMIHYENGKALEPEKAKVKVRYEVIRVDNRWRIREISLLDNKRVN
jgi:ARC6-like, IMS domain/DnaJ domain